MGKDHILVVDDEKDILDLISYNLKKEGYRVTAVTNAEEALETAAGNPPDLILLDIMLPGMDGLECCRKFKSDPDLCRIPVVMVSARGEESDVVVGLELGASDYVIKPFSPRVLIARIRAVLRRTEPPLEGNNDIIRNNDLVIHPGRHEVLVKGKPVKMTTTEFRLLIYLARRPGWVFTRNQILDALHGDGYQVVERSVDVQVVGLRKKLGSAGKYIETVRGVGYRYRE